MPRDPQLTYRLYGQGYQPRELWLGHLVFGNWKDPTRGKTCQINASNEPLVDNDLVIQDEIIDRVLLSKNRASVGGSITAIEFLNLGGLFRDNKNLIVAAKKCRRIRIQDNKVDEFLEKHVLSNEPAVQALQRWTSITKSNYLKHIMLTRDFRVPHVWMLTGLYEMNDARAFRTTERVVSMEAGVGAEIMAALGVPVSAGINIETNQKMIDGGSWVGARVWAAQYQLLRLRYRFVASEEALPGLTLPLQMRHVYIPGGFLGSESDSDDDEENHADNAVTVQGCVDMDTTEIDVDQDYVEFFEAFDRTEKRWDEADESNALLLAPE